LEFISVPGSDPRAEVARQLVNQGYDLLEMLDVGLSLEEIFMQLTSDEPGLPRVADVDMAFEDRIDRDG
jgi:hypothetical protein